MNLRSRSLASLLALGAGLVAPLLAQTSAPEAGLLGRRYAGADFTFDQFTASSLDQGMGATALVNVPVARAFDVQLGYSYLDTTGDRFSAIDKTLSASLVTYRDTEYGKGYFAATLAHGWNHVGAPLARHDNTALWGARAGYEIAIGARTAVNLGVGYSQSFDRDNERAKVLRAYAELNHWFSRDVAGVASIGYKEISHFPDAIAYAVGLRWAF